MMNPSTDTLYNFSLNYLSFPMIYEKINGDYDFCMKIVVRSLVFSFEGVIVSYVYKTKMHLV